jgi:23S rRNA pseudouridine2605 synthase
MTDTPKKPTLSKPPRANKAADGVTSGKRGDRKPVKVLKKVKAADGKSRLVRPGAPGFEAAPPVIGTAKADQRIAKHLARVGIGSRREIERMIADGRIRLNGKVLETPATLVGPNDKIEVDGEPVGARERTRLWLYHKPSGLVTTNKDPEGRPTVFEKLPVDIPRVLSVGRLDITTEGLLLLTNDGGLARQLELPSTGWLRRYRVRVHGDVDEQALAELEKGIAVEGVLYGSIEATLDRKQGSNSWLTLGLREGKNREVRNVLGALGLEVNRLIRISYGPFQLGEMESGEVREIRGRTLRDQLGTKLIEASGADFDSELRENAAGGAKDAPKRPNTRGKPQNARGGDRRDEKTGHGQARRETFDRLDTRKRDDSRSGGFKRDSDKRGGEKRGGEKREGEKRDFAKRGDERRDGGKASWKGRDDKPKWQGDKGGVRDGKGGSRDGRKSPGDRSTRSDRPTGRPSRPPNRNSAGPNRGPRKP